MEQASNGGVVSHGRFFKQKGDEMKKKNFVEHYLIHDHISWLMFQEIHGRHSRKLLFEAREWERIKKIACYAETKFCWIPSYFYVLRYCQVYRGSCLLENRTNREARFSSMVNNTWLALNRPVIKWFVVRHKEEIRGNNVKAIQEFIDKC